MIAKQTPMHKPARLGASVENAKNACQKVKQTNVSNRILLGMTQGIGNAILVTPLIQALISLGLQIDIITDGLIRGAERVLKGIEGVRLIKEADISPDDIYLLGLQTLWPYEGLDKYVSQVRIAGNIHDLWNAGILAHEVEVNMSLAYSLKYDGGIPPLYTYHEPVKIETDSNRKIVGIHVCRKYTHQFYANRRLNNPFAIAEALYSEGYDIVIIGHEGSVTNSDKSKYPNFNYYDGLGLEQAAGLIKELDCMINEDSGIMHLTAAVDTPQVTVFGPTSWVKNRAYSEKAVLVRKDIDCLTCQYTERQNNCFSNICMDVEPSFVVECVNELLGVFPR